MIAKVNQNECIGCELCVQICPDIFAMEENVAITIADTVPQDLEPSCIQAAETCPVNAIKTKE